MPDEPAKFESPEYVAVTVSVPMGAFVAWHDPAPLTRASVVHRVVAPSVNVTVPVGIGFAAEVTVAEYVTAPPEALVDGFTDAFVVVPESHGSLCEVYSPVAAFRTPCEPFVLRARVTPSVLLGVPGLDCEPFVFHRSDQGARHRQACCARTYMWLTPVIASPSPGHARPREHHQAVLRLPRAPSTHAPETPTGTGPPPAPSWWERVK